MSVYEHVGGRIKELRTSYAGKGISQEELAKALEVAPNTISRWETAAYKPELKDLDALARFFGVSILSFLPEEEPRPDARMTALLRAAKSLPDEDLDELQRFAEFRKAEDFMRKRGGRRK